MLFYFSCEIFSSFFCCLLLSACLFNARLYRIDIKWACARARDWTSIYGTATATTTNKIPAKCIFEMGKRNKYYMAEKNVRKQQQQPHIILPTTHRVIGYSDVRNLPEDNSVHVFEGHLRERRRKRYMRINNREKKNEESCITGNI